MSNLTHVSNSLPFPTQRLGVAPQVLCIPCSATVALCPTPALMRHTVENSNWLLRGPLLKGGGGGNQPQINILFILPLKPTSQEPACSFPFSIYTFQKTMISY